MYIQTVLLASAMLMSEGPAKHEAAVVISQGSVIPQTIRCTTQKVGAYVEDGQALQNVRIEGCQVAIAQRGNGPITGVTIDTCLAGIWLLGDRAQVYDNQIFGCEYGIVVQGERNTVRNNRLVQPVFDGVLITGDLNDIRENRVELPGGHGIHVVGSVPNIGLGQYLPRFRQMPRHNGIIGNTIVSSEERLPNSYDLRQWPLSCPNSGNTWSRNIFSTRSGVCLN